MKASRLILISSLILLIFSCGKKEETCQLDEDILDQELELTITRLEQEFFSAKTQEDFSFLLEKHPEFTQIYLQADLYPSLDTLASELLAIHQDSAMQVLNDSVQQVFTDFSDVEKQLENAFKYIKHYFPEFKIPKVYTFVSGFNSDLVVTEDIIVIGLDYYLPPSHTFQPELARYMAERYDRPYIVPMIVTAISSRFNQTNPQDKTLLAEMIYYGKAYHFTKAILPCTSDQFIIGYTPEQISESFANEEFIWAHFVENELLYETNPFEIRKYMGEAPFTDAISTKAPGRLGRWLGWNIVDDYVFNQDVSLYQLMGNPDAEQIFRQSGYRPRPPA
ncbi:MULTISPECIES: gliding motility lipoprotein GldB [Algoriphagus]|jgi:gliding motility-associated lipoprotein GldB|uniref:gliding motility lipoprotein GldB n=1 Tax=Algoriphagus TaxID=246875 RepID=UPI000C37BA83|nr:MULTISPECIES: gliding motility lipoprotein GldB [Algoriphagus]MAL12077.1 gliding motility lipoprotein GldB [Algoriphagus sp.]MAN87070.1 gliding motility lipoprotein GldB [Algoriphagus sp.]QYH40528.1 gliding motility lipoprotein GldB [Algoriphagus sp. NBT04N3]HAD50604.1 gliding motility lipoprotein GldB [Algoriphagus sp.]HAS57542.1 gliding motility lipoprotein GldB [Algoriphagus sp.]|tara:strand:- start:9265 stop:10269 length:1005 start_codon:yes stop_codon:yes gene_type:complete